MATKSFTVTLGVKISAAPGANKQYQALRAFADNPAVLVNMVKASMAETLVEAYQRRFKISEGVMSNMEAVHEGDLGPKTEAERKRKEERRALMIEHREALRSGDQIKANVIAKRLSDIVHALEGSGAGRRFKETQSILYRAGKGKTLFRDQMNAVYMAMSEIEVAATRKGSVTLGIGNMGQLDQIKTPSYAEYAKGGETHSPYNIMWRHLEYGTGYYAKPVREGGDSKGWGGSWWYGPKQSKRRAGLHILGSRGGHFLRNASGLPYDHDASQFQAVLAERLFDHLLG